jgi:hypothetical protein
VSLDLSDVKRVLEAELQKCNTSCKEALQNYVANMSTNADFQQVSDISCRDRYRHVISCICCVSNDSTRVGFQYITGRSVNE